MQVFDGKKQTPTNSKDHQVFLIMNVSQDYQEFHNFWNTNQFSKNGDS